MSKISSPLRYPGGKSKLYKYTKTLIEKNNLSGCTYVEPFAGGSGLALSLLFNNIVAKIILNDLDRSIYAFWYSLLNNSEEFIRLVERTPISVNEWYKQKKLQEQKETLDLLTLGFSTFFLNRTNRSGILSAGPIGGYKQESEYKIDSRFKKESLIKRLLKVAEYKNKIKFYNYDSIYFLNRIVSRQRRPTFIFFDPPYYNKGPELYVKHLKHDNHIELSQKIKSLSKSYWVLTYDNEIVIEGMYKQYKPTRYNLRYSASGNQIGTELMMYSDNIVPLPFEISKKL